MNSYRAFNIDALGFSHLSSGLPKQDNTLSNVSDAYAIAAVADGHGSPQYIRSDRGSAFAVEVCVNLLTDMFTRGVDAKRNAEKLKRFIKRDWDKKVVEDFAANPLTLEEDNRLRAAIDSESDGQRRAKISNYLKAFQSGEKIQKAYGSTLIATASCDACVMGIHIGDGTCVAFYEDGTCDQPIPIDSRNMASTTSSLCNDDPGCRVYFFDRKPIAVFVASDGLDDSYGQGEQLCNFYRRVCMELARNDEEYIQVLQSNLAKISEMGSKDDMSIAGIYDLEALKRILPIMEKRLSCGRLKHERNILEETNGGISPYSLESKRKKCERAQEMWSEAEEENKTILKKLKEIKDKIFGYKRKFNYDDPDEVQKRLSFIDEQKRRYEIRQAEILKDINEAERKLKAHKSEYATVTASLEQAQKEKDRFHREYEDYRACHTDEQSIGEKSRTIADQVEQAKQDATDKEVAYQNALTTYNNAQTRKKELDEQIQRLEEEIQKAVESLQPISEIVEPTSVQEKEPETSDVDVKAESIEPSEPELVSNKTDSGNSLLDADIVSMLDNNSRRNES